MTFLTDQCNYCGVKAQKLLRCSGCQKSVYCSKEHQKLDWKIHKAMCKQLQANAESFDIDVDEGEFVGTFRWGSKHKFPAVPDKFPRIHPQLDGGWGSYIETRFPRNSQGTIAVDPSQLDGLSFPMTVVYVLDALNIDPSSVDCFRIISVGAAARAEERVVRETNYWKELEHFHPSAKFTVDLVGPEVSTQMNGKTHQVSENVLGRFFRGGVKSYLDKHPLKVTEPNDTLVVGYNTGYGSGNESLLLGWMGDLIQLVSSNVPVLFTCANDYSDLAGEVRVMKELIRGKFILHSSENPFRAVSTAQGPTNAVGMEKSYSCANEHMYAIQGFEKGCDGPKVDVNNAKQLKKVVAAFAKSLRHESGEILSADLFQKIADMTEELDKTQKTGVKNPLVGGPVGNTEQVSINSASNESTSESTGTSNKKKKNKNKNKKKKKPTAESQSPPVVGDTAEKVVVKDEEATAVKKPQDNVKKDSVKTDVSTGTTAKVVTKKQTEGETKTETAETTTAKQSSKTMSKDIFGDEDVVEAPPAAAVEAPTVAVEKTPKKSPKINPGKTHEVARASTTTEESSVMTGSDQGVSYIVKAEQNETVVTFTVPTGIRGKDLDLDVESRVVHIQHSNFDVDVNLPMAVDVDNVSAKFNKHESTLTVKLTKSSSL